MGAGVLSSKTGTFPGAWWASDWLTSGKSKGKRPCNYSDGSLKRASITRQRLPGHGLCARWREAPCKCAQRSQRAGNPQSVALWQTVSVSGSGAGGEWMGTVQEQGVPGAGGISDQPGRRQILTDGAHSVHTWALPGAPGGEITSPGTVFQHCACPEFLGEDWGAEQPKLQMYESRWRVFPSTDRVLKACFHWFT